MLPFSGVHVTQSGFSQKGGSCSLTSFSFFTPPLYSFQLGNARPLFVAIIIFLHNTSCNFALFYQPFSVRLRKGKGALQPNGCRRKITGGSLYAVL